VGIGLSVQDFEYKSETEATRDGSILKKEAETGTGTDMKRERIHPNN
jgi:hypothetical protein